MKKLIISLMALTIILTGCSTTEAEPVVEEPVVEESVEETNVSTITFGDTITSDNSTVLITGNSVTITEPGDYELAGSSSDANVIVETSVEEDVNLILNNLDLTSSTTAPIYVKSADSVTITTTAGTVNSLTDSANNQELQAPLSSDEARLYLTGEGILNITSNSQEGIECNDEIFMEGGVVNVTSPDDGINAGDGITLDGGVLTIDCEGDGIDSNDYLTFNGGEYYVSAGNNANGPLDTGEDAATMLYTINGASFIAVGGSMGIVPSTTTQGGFAIDLSGEAGLYQIYDSSDKLIVEADIPKAFSYMTVSSPEMIQGETYTVKYEGQEVTTVTLDELYSNQASSHMPPMM